MADDRTIYVDLAPEEERRLTELAAAKGVTVNALAVQVIMQHLDRLSAVERSELERECSVIRAQGWTADDAAWEEIAAYTDDEENRADAAE